MKTFRIPLPLMTRVVHEYVQIQGFDVDSDPRGSGHIDLLCKVTGVRRSVIQNVWLGNAERLKSVSFSDADMIVTRLFGPHLWHGDRVLRSYYES